MLKILTVWNFALLEHVQVDFAEGLNILTGETGAGKSILIDAVGAVLGQRVTTAEIRTECDWLRVEAVFSLDGQQNVKDFLTEQAICFDNDELIITRQLTRNGRGAILINGCHTTLAVLKELGKLLIDIHGQNQNLALLEPKNQFLLLDGFSAASAEAKEIYQQKYSVWQQRKKELAELQEKAAGYGQRIDMLRWQDKEIAEAQLKPGEDVSLEQEIKRAANAEKIAGYVSDAYNQLEGSGTQFGVLAALSEVKRSLAALERYDSSLAGAAQMISEAECQLQEAVYEIRDYSESLEFQPHKLDEMQKRMDVIDKLRKKYGATVEDVLQHHQKIKAELEAIENYDDDTAALQEQVAKCAQELTAAAAVLTEKRKQAAAYLADKISGQLLALGMKHARFTIEVNEQGEFLPTGRDKVALLFSANLGEDLKPVEKIASGGELSRIVLAIKAITAERDNSPASMIFDEIDTGIGGETARMVAERIAMVAAFKQVLCITHLPQIACMADNHLYIQKQVVGQATETRVIKLAEGERVNEVARMASGADVTAASLDNAREMLDNATLKKKKICTEIGSGGNF